MSTNLLDATFSMYKENIDSSGLQCGLGQDITSKDKKKIFLKAGTPLTEKIKNQIEQLKKEGIIELLNPDDSIEVLSPTESEDLVGSIMATIKSSPVLTKYQLKETLQTITGYVKTGDIPKKLIEHLTVFSKCNELAFNNTLSNLVFGTHIGIANNYSPSELYELMTVLFFEDIGLSRLDIHMKNANKVHPILSKEILLFAGIDNKLILESVLQHEEKIDGSGYPNQLTQIHEYAQISQLANQHSKLIKQGEGAACLLGKLYLLGQSFEFRTSNAKTRIYESKIQKMLLKVLQEKLHSPQQFIDYGNHLHQELSKIIMWTNSEISKDNEIVTIQQKIKNVLWVDKHSSNPFYVSSEQLKDLTLCKEFIIDSMSFLFQISESANYLNCQLHKPIELNGSPISRETCLNLANPLYH